MNDYSVPALPAVSAHADILYGPSAPELLREEILADLFEASARRAPEQIALIYGER